MHIENFPQNRVNKGELVQNQNYRREGLPNFW